MALLPVNQITNDEHHGCFTPYTVQVEACIQVYVFGDVNTTVGIAFSTNNFLQIIKSHRELDNK